MFFSGPWHLGLIKDAGGAGFEGKWDDRADAQEGRSATSFVGGSNMVVFKDSKNKDAGLGVRPVPVRPDDPGQVVQDVTDLPAVQAAWDDPAAQGRPARRRCSASSSKDTKAPPAIATWARSRTRSTTSIEKITTGDVSPEAGRRGDAAAGRVDRHRLIRGEADDDRTRRWPSGAAGGRSARSGRPPRRAGWRQDLAGWAFAAPFVARLRRVPGRCRSLASVVLSASRTSGCATCANPLGTTFVGLDNYLDADRRRTFWTALFNTFYFVVVGVPLTLVARPRGRRWRSNRGIQKFRTAVPRRLLPAGRHQHRRHRGRLALPPQPGRRA